MNSTNLCLSKHTNTQFQPQYSKQRKIIKKISMKFETIIWSTTISNQLHIFNKQVKSTLNQNTKPEEHGNINLKNNHENS